MKKLTHTHTQTTKRNQLCNNEAKENCLPQHTTSSHRGKRTTERMSNIIRKIRAAAALIRTDKPQSIEK